MYLVNKRFHQLAERVSRHRMHVIGLRLVQNQIGDDAIVLPSIAQDLMHFFLALAHKCSIAVVFFGVHIDAHDELQSGSLHQFELRFRELTPSANSVVTRFFNHF